MEPKTPPRTVWDTLPVTPMQSSAKRRRSGIGGQSSSKKRISPKKASTTVIPGGRVPDGTFVALPKGSMMELLQVRDLEISRLMEELVDYEEEATILTHQLYVSNRELDEAAHRAQEVAQEVGQLQEAVRRAAQSQEPAKGLKYQPDGLLVRTYENILGRMRRLATTYCASATNTAAIWRGEYAAGAPLIAPANPGEDAAIFNSFLPGRPWARSVTCHYLALITNRDILRCNFFQHAGMQHVVGAIIMRILKDEVFDRFRFMMRAEPFWDPVEAKYPRTELNGNVEVVLSTNTDLLVEQEASSVLVDEVAYQFNSLRARMVNHLIMQHRGFGPYLTEYLDRIGVLILNSIAVFLDDNSLIQNGLAGNFHNPITKEKYSLQDLLGVAQVRDRNDFSPDGRPAEAQQKPEERLYYEIHDLVYAAAGLSLMMRSDYSLCYMDMGGLNLRWDRAMMEHSGTFFNQTSPMDTWLARSIESQRKNPRRALNAFAFLVVAPAMKRTGSEGGKGYTEVRLLKKTLAYGVPISEEYNSYCNIPVPVEPPPPAPVPVPVVVQAPGGAEAAAQAAPRRQESPAQARRSASATRQRTRGPTPVVGQEPGPAPEAAPQTARRRSRRQSVAEEAAPAPAPAPAPAAVRRRSTRLPSEPAAPVPAAVPMVRIVSEEELAARRRGPSARR